MILYVFKIVDIMHHIDLEKNFYFSFPSVDENEWKKMELAAEFNFFNPNETWYFNH